MVVVELTTTHNVKSCIIITFLWFVHSMNRKELKHIFSLPSFHCLGRKVPPLLEVTFFLPKIKRNLLQHSCLRVNSSIRILFLVQPEKLQVNKCQHMLGIWNEAIQQFCHSIGVLNCSFTIYYVCFNGWRFQFQK